MHRLYAGIPVDHGCKFQPYWLNTSGNAILRDLLERVDSRRQRELYGLLQGKPVEVPAMENFVFADIRSNRNALFMFDIAFFPQKENAPGAILERVSPFMGVW